MCTMIASKIAVTGAGKGSQGWFAVRQAIVGYDLWMLTFSIAVEAFTSAIGTVIFVAYLSALCQSPLHTATQYALLTALAALGRTVFALGAGYIAAAAGWPMYFVICALTAIPSFGLLFMLTIVCLLLGAAVMFARL